MWDQLHTLCRTVYDTWIDFWFAHPAVLIAIATAMLFLIIEGDL